VSKTRNRTRRSKWCPCHIAESKKGCAWSALMVLRSTRQFEGEPCLDPYLLIVDLDTSKPVAAATPRQFIVGVTNACLSVARIAVDIMESHGGPQSSRPAGHLMRRYGNQRRPSIPYCCQPSQAAIQVQVLEDRKMTNFQLGCIHLSGVH
jgi:hypothetical protein